MTKAIRVAINGAGRIGRAFYKLAQERPEIEVVAVNDLCDRENLEYLLKHGAKVIIAGHLGQPQPNNESRIKNHELSLRPVAEWLIKRFHNSLFIPHDSKRGEFDGWEITPKLFLLVRLQCLSSSSRQSGYIPLPGLQQILSSKFF